MGSPYQEPDDPAANIPVDSGADIDKMLAERQQQNMQMARALDPNAPPTATGTVPPPSTAPPTTPPPTPNVNTVGAGQPVGQNVVNPEALPAPTTALAGASSPPAENAPASTIGATVPGADQTQPGGGMDPATALSPMPTRPTVQAGGADPTTAQSPGQPEAKPPPEFESKVTPQGNPGAPQTALPPVDTKPEEQKPVPVTPQIKPSMRRYTQLQQTDPQLFTDLNGVAVHAGVDPVALANVMYLESRWNMNVGDSNKGAIGPMQVLPETAREVDPSGHLNPRDPHDNLLLGAMYLRQMFDKYGTGTAAAYAAYFAGPGAVDTIARLSPEDQRKQFPHVLNYAREVSRDNMNGVVRPGAGTPDDRSGASSGLANVNATLQSRTAAWLASLTPEERQGIKIVSGFRTFEQQQQLYNQGGIVASPGNSAHNHGLGFDIQGMSPSAAQKLSQFGLAQNVPGDPMHVEPVEIPSAATASAADRAAAFRSLASGQTPFRQIASVPGTTDTTTLSSVYQPGPVSSGGDQSSSIPARYTVTPGSNADFPTAVSAAAKGGPDAAMSYLQGTNPRGMESSDMLRSLQLAGMRWALYKGPEALDKVMEFTTMLGSQGAFQHLRQGYGLYAAGDMQGAAKEYETAFNNYFPDGTQVRARGVNAVRDAQGNITAPGSVWLERFDPRSGKRIGDPFQLDPGGVQRMMNISSNPQTYLKTLHDMQTQESQRLHYEGLNQHYTNMARQAAETDKTRREVANQVDARARDLALQNTQLRIAELNQKGITESFARSKEVAPLVQQMVEGDDTLKDPKLKQAVSAVMNQMLMRDTGTSAQQAYYYGTGLLNGNIVTGRPYQHGGTATSPGEWRVPLMTKGSDTPLTYLPRDTLQGAGLWTRDLSKPNEPGKPVAPPKTAPSASAPLPPPVTTAPQVPPMVPPS